NTSREGQNMGIGIGEIICVLLLVGTVVYGIKTLKSHGIGSKQKLMASGVPLLALGLVDFWLGTILNAGEAPVGYLMELFGILAFFLVITDIVLEARTRTKKKKKKKRNYPKKRRYQPSQFYSKGNPT